MPTGPRWADLLPELVCRIADGLDDLKCYASVRGACKTWRRTLVPPSPLLLVDHGDDPAKRCTTAAIKRRTTAASILARCSFELNDIPSGQLCPAARRSFKLVTIPSVRTCLGYCSGWLALSVRIDDVRSLLSLFHPIIAAEILLPPLVYDSRLVSKIVFAPNPATDDFMAAVICDINRVAYVTAGARRWAILDPIRLTIGDQLADLLYHGNGRVYYLTRFGDVHVLLLPQCCRWEPIILEGPTSTYTAVHNRQIIKMHGIGPDLNAPATIETLFSSVGSNLFDDATGFAPPYNTILTFTSVKNLVFCNGNLYQIWRNASCTVTLQLLEGGRCRVAHDEIFVLRYDPQRRPCWDVVADLGGYSVFIGRNNSVLIYAEGVPGLKGDCVYWIGGRGRDQGMVFDMKTGRSTPCIPLVDGVLLGSPQSTICLYFLSDE
ncbi:unnamed protein product [Triticum turgidum subsp. durum]|uniref:KIB1-4 beta-propeller domain-containing protein n=1 Tax=Triticum turgidum subsp. durum TaxID=4567 RepID=A0A9R0TG95_TRITD|nr:unnamed protein product [Triticum turgidum subsp. durum]